MSEMRTMNETRRPRQSFLDALLQKALHITPIRGRYLLNLKSCRDDAIQTEMERLAARHVTLGNTLASLGLWEDALCQWQRAVQLDPLSSDARNNLAVAYELRGEPTLAKSEYDQALALEPNNVYIRQNYEVCRHETATHSTPDVHQHSKGPVLCH